MEPSGSHPDDELGPVEQELVRLLRGLDLADLDPDRRERCWQEFRELARLPERSPAPPEGPATPEPPVTGEATPETPVARQSAPRPRLRWMPRPGGAA